jgi:hypothetical protein
MIQWPPNSHVQVDGFRTALTVAVIVANCSNCCWLKSAMGDASRTDDHSDVRRWPPESVLPAMIRYDAKLGSIRS